jgi:hypothetical protein
MAISSKVSANEQIQRIMSGLKCTEAEAKEIYAYDKMVDGAGAKERLEFDLSLEAEKEAKKLANSRERKPTVYKFDKRERKKNATKGAIIAEIAKYLAESGETAYEKVNITNEERQIAFSVGDNDFELTLVQKRKPKK